MRADADQTVEIQNLKSCINDLLGILALPALWTEAEQPRIVDILADVLRDMLRADFVFVRLRLSACEQAIETLRTSSSQVATTETHKFGETLNSIAGASQEWPLETRTKIKKEEYSIIGLRLGLQGDFGAIFVGSKRVDFPLQTERLLLSVAANQAIIELEEARRRSDQRRAASELDKMVAKRTIELATANEELKNEILERRRVEEKLIQEERQLQRSEALLNEAQRLSLTGSFAWRISTDEFIWSRQTYRLYEIDPLTPPTLDLIAARIHPEDISIFRDMVDVARGEGSDMDCEFRLLMSDGSIKYVRCVAHGIRDIDGQLEYIGAIQDVTERRRAEDAICEGERNYRELRLELAHANRVSTMGQLSAALSHEVKQPLAGLVIHANAALKRLAATPPDIDAVQRTLAHIVADGHRAAQILDRTRAFIKKVPPKKESVDLNSTIAETVALVAAEARQKRIAVRIAPDDALPLVVGDRIQLQQVILNLIVNALDAIAGADVQQREVVVISRKEPSGGVFIAVQDSGPGVRREDLERLFEAFYTTKSEGMGMGLAICRGIVESHGGHLWIAPNEPQGAIFQFTLPVNAAEQPPSR